MSLGLNNRAGAGMRVCLDLGTALSKASLFLGEDLPPRSAVAPLPIGAAAGAEHPLLAPSAMYVDDGRIYFGSIALERARAAGEAKRLPVLSFKMVLSAREIEPTLALKLSRSVDPSSTLTHRDALVLYLAYLDQLIRAAVAAEPTLPPAGADAPRRLTSPHWRARDEVTRTVGRLVEEGATVASELGVAVLASQGVSLSRVKEALEKAAGAPAKRQFGGIVFEAHSAASAYAAFACSRAQFVLVIDMGAGTTDIAGFEYDADAPQSGLMEIPGARQWCALAGDEIDNILIDLFIRASGGRGRDAEARLWRGLRLSAHRLKCDLFGKGKAAFEEGRRRIVVRLKTLQEDASFKAFCRALSQAFATRLDPVAAKAKQAGVESVAVLLAGGGAGLPFLADLIRTAAARTGHGLKLEIEPFGANWALPHQHHPLAGSFPQLAISMGGALAQIGEDVDLAPETV